MPRAYDLHQLQATNNPLNRPVAEAVPHYVKDMSEFLFNILKQVFEAEVKFFINGILGIIGMATEPVKWIEPIIGVLPSTKQVVQALTGMSDGDWQDLVDWANKVDDTIGDAAQLILDVATLKSFEQINQDVIKLWTDFLKAISGKTNDPGTIVKAVHDFIQDPINNEFSDLQKRMNDILNLMQYLGADVTEEGKESKESFENARQLVNELNTNIGRIISGITALDTDITTTSRGGNMVIDTVDTAVGNLGGAINTSISDVAKIPPLIAKVTVNMDGKDKYSQLKRATNDLTSPIASMTSNVQSLPNRARIAGADGKGASDTILGFGQLAGAADDLAKNVDKMIRDFFNTLTGSDDGTPHSAADYITNLKHAFDKLFKDWNDFLSGIFGEGGAVTPTGEAAADFIDKIKSATDNLGKMITDIIDAITGRTDGTTKDIGDVIQHMKDATATAEKNAADALKNMADAAASILDDVNATASDLGKALQDINKVTDGVLGSLGKLLDGVTGKKDATPEDAADAINNHGKVADAAAKVANAVMRSLPIFDEAQITEFKNNGTWTNPFPKDKRRIGVILINGGENGGSKPWWQSGDTYGGRGGGWVMKEFFTTDLPPSVSVVVGKKADRGKNTLVSSFGRYVSGRNGVVGAWINGGAYIGLPMQPGDGGDPGHPGYDSILANGGEPGAGKYGGGDGQALPTIGQNNNRPWLVGGAGGAGGDSPEPPSQQGGVPIGGTAGGAGSWPGGGGGAWGGDGANGVVWVLLFPPDQDPTNSTS